MMIKCKFHEQELYLIDGNTIDSPLASAEDYRNGIVGYAHVFNGKIMRYGKEIGTVEELEVLEEVEDLDMSTEGMARNILGMRDILIKGHEEF